MEKLISDRVYVIKGLCILCAIYAHMSSQNETCMSIMTAIGTLGVPLFFMLSGYFYNYEKYSIKQMIKKKSIRIVLPWIFCSVLTYALSAVVSRHFEIFDMIKWILGIGTWYYYVTVLLVLYFIFYKFHSNLFCLICILLNIISIFIYRFDLIEGLSGSMHINIFNWIGFFALGVIIRKKDMLKNVFAISDKIGIFILSFCILTAIIIINTMTGYTMTYISSFSILAEFCGALILIYLSQFICSKYIYIYR